MKSMEETIFGLNFWTWLGFLFLILAGICSAKAAKVSSAKIVKKSVDQITHPIQDLYTFAISHHKQINDNYLRNLTSYGAIFLAISEMKKGNNIINNGEDVKVTQLEKANQKLNSDITITLNSYSISLATLKLLAEDLENPMVSEKIISYEDFVKQARNTKSDLIQGGIKYDEFVDNVTKAKTSYAEFLELLNQIKTEVLERQKSNK